MDNWIWQEKMQPKTDFKWGGRMEEGGCKIEKKKIVLWVEGLGMD